MKSLLILLFLSVPPPAMDRLRQLSGMATFRWSLDL